MRAKPKYVSQTVNGTCFKNWCGPACVCSVLNKEGTLQNLHEIADKLCVAGPTASDTTQVDGFVQYFKSLLIKCGVIKKPDIASLESKDEKSKIILLLKKDSGVSGHAVVYWKYDKKEDKVYVMDPGALEINGIHSRDDIEPFIDYALVIITD